MTIRDKPVNRVFISYSHKDEGWKDRIVTQLGVLALDAKLELWDDRRIDAGDDWLPEIQQAIEACDVALLLISADFLTSKFITEQEVPRLLELRAGKGVRIIPVILKPCVWSKVSWLGGIQARPKDGKALSTLSESAADEALAALVEEVLRLTQASATPTTTPATEEEELPGQEKRPRRIDAVVPSKVETGRDVDLFVQVRFTGSEPLGIQDWPFEKLPDSLGSSSQKVDLVFRRDPRTEKLEPARLRVVIVSSDFEVQNGKDRLVEVPPRRFSQRVSFLLKPVRTGDCRINVEVYDLGNLLLGTVPLETTVGVTGLPRTCRVASLPLTVEVGSPGDRTGAAALPPPFEQVKASAPPPSRSRRGRRIVQVASALSVLAIGGFISLQILSNRFKPQGLLFPGNHAKDRGTLVLSSMPAAATYEIKTAAGELLRTGQTPAIVTGLPADTYTVTMLADYGWSAFQEKVVVNASKEIQVSAHLQPEVPWTNSVGLVFVPINGTKTLISLKPVSKDAVLYLTNSAFAEWAKECGFNFTNHSMGNTALADGSMIQRWLNFEDRKRGLLGASGGYRLDVGTNGLEKVEDAARLIFEQ